MVTLLQSIPGSANKRFRVSNWLVPVASMILAFPFAAIAFLIAAAAAFPQLCPGPQDPVHKNFLYMLACSVHTRKNIFFLIKEVYRNIHLTMIMQSISITTAL
jgi:hypothetical protein